MEASTRGALELAEVALRRLSQLEQLHTGGLGRDTLAAIRAVREELAHEQRPPLRRRLVIGLTRAAAKATQGGGSSKAW